MKITFEFPDYKKTDVLGAAEFRKSRIQEAIAWLEQNKDFLPSTLTLDQLIGEGLIVRLRRDQDTW